VSRRQPGLPDPARREPLWDRVDRNRVRLAAYVLLFVVTTVVALDAFFVLLLGAILLFTNPWTLITYSSEPPLFPPMLVWASIAFAALASAWAAFMLLRSEKWLLRRLNATLVPKGEHLDTKMALKDMALAGGLAVAPTLYVLDSSNVNAFVFAARRRRAVVGVTQGLVDKLPVDLQRAVFANLIARLIEGDTIVSTGVTALVWPLYAWREGVLERQNEEMNDQLCGADRQLQTAELGAGVIPLVIFGFAFSFVVALLATGHRVKQLRTSEKADAEGMLLLKEPAQMLAAIERCIQLDNVVPVAGETFADLFYCWTGDSTDDETDPEWERVSRLREVLGVEGWIEESADSARESYIPCAPRLEQARGEKQL
jgi:Zn-dependent protease with chaperone function